MRTTRTKLNIEKCRMCGAEIIFCHNIKSGKVMPFDVKPDPKGGWRIAAGATASYDPDAEDPKYTSHFSTCPHADVWRKKKAKP